MPELYNQMKFQQEAFLEKISYSIVYPSTVHPDGSDYVGTGVVIKYSEAVFVVSALHNFCSEGSTVDDIIKTWNSAPFRLRDDESLKFHDRREPPINSLAPREGILLPLKSSPLIDREHDLIVGEVEGKRLPKHIVHLLDLTQNAHTGELKQGTPLTTVGMPRWGGVKIPGGPRVLHPYTNAVLYDPQLQLPLPSAQDPADYFFMQYTRMEDGIDPRGFSGAAVWLDAGADLVVWTPTPKIVGIVLRYFPK